MNSSIFVEISFLSHIDLFGNFFYLSACILLFSVFILLLLFVCMCIYVFCVFCCFYYCFIYLLSKEREKESMGLGGWKDMDDLGRNGGGED